MRVLPRLLGALLLMLPLLPGLLGRAGAGRLAEAIDRGWAPFCHRIPERCLVFLGAPMPICSRCLGLVVGLGLGLLVACPELSSRRLLWVVGAAGVFMVIEVATQDLGLHPVFHPTRLLSGFLLAYPIGAAASALASGRPEHRQHRQPHKKPRPRQAS